MNVRPFLLGILSFGLLACSEGNVSTFVNPVLGGDYPDPTVMREGNDYYMTNSSMEYMPGLLVSHSTDLIHWEPISNALTEYLGSVWAPDISKIGDKYYIYFTVATGNRRNNWVVVADSPYGPWEGPYDLHVGHIDPCPAIDEQGRKWLYLGGGRRIRLTDDGLDTVDGTKEGVYHGWPIPDDWIIQSFSLEGPKLKKIGDWWYYINAEGGTAGPPTSHMAVVARARTLSGPWENSPYNPLVHTYDNSDRWWSRGHASLIDTPDGDWYIMYHAYENGHTGLGRQVLLEPVSFNEEGWPVTVGGVDDLTGPIESPIASMEEDRRKSHLNEFRIGLDWKFFRDYDPDRFEVKDNSITLRCEGEGPFDSAPLMFVAGEHSYEYEAEITLSGDDALAGIGLFYNSDAFYYLTFDSELIYQYMCGKVRPYPKRHGLGRHFYVRLRNDDQIVSFYTSTDGNEWKLLQCSNDVSGFNNNVFGGYMSMLPGFVAAGEGTVTISNFKYRTL